MEQFVERLLLGEDVGFHLVHGREHFTVGGQVGEAAAREVAHAQGTYFSHHEGGFHGAPSAVVVTVGLVDEEQIDVVGAKTLQTLVDGGSRFAFAGIADPDLGGEKEVFASHTAAANAFAHAAFVLIDLCGVDEAVADVDGVGHTACRFFVTDLKNAVAESGHRQAVVEFDVLHNNIGG